MATEHEKALAWRKAKGWSRGELSSRLKLSDSVIQNMEAGTDLATGKAVDPAAFNRYRLACAALDRGLDRWDWS